ncbi:hypothetical protein AN643_00560 [Candidatus Epulonipiscioides saccharophilum]|nr:hypothetical protein AN643_00560 [Epulopiscium sp. SCG-B10WGA-EpuloB]
MLMITTDFIDEKEIEILGLVSGSTVQSKNVGGDLVAGLQNFVGGELKGYTEMLEDARKEAINRMIYKAKVLVADAIIGVRFTSNTIAQGAVEVLVYGTAVKFKESEQI